ncbi:MAG: hypothetical protein N4A50_03060 [Vallitalea sp.]|jgi:hypothetical protein|nr:hypothetical protein [Vallitalea sp.]
MSPYIKTEEDKYYKADNNNQPYYDEQPYNPWNVFPGLRQDISYEEKSMKKQPRQPRYDSKQPSQPYDPWSIFPGRRPMPPKKKKPVDRSKKDPSLKYIPAPVIRDYIGKIINTYIPGYGRVNVYVKGIDRNGMVHLVIIEPDPSDYIYVHNSDMVGIYPPTL